RRRPYVPAGLCCDERLRTAFLRGVPHPPLASSPLNTFTCSARPLISGGTVLFQAPPGIIRAPLGFAPWMSLTKLNVLIVHAHHEPKSFCSALFRHAVQTLSDAGHAVVISDLYAQRFDPVSDRRNFTSVFDADYLKQGAEERHATA